MCFMLLIYVSFLFCFCSVHLLLDLLLDLLTHALTSDLVMTLSSVPMHGMIMIVIIEMHEVSVLVFGKRVFFLSHCSVVEFLMHFRVCVGVDDLELVM